MTWLLVYLLAGLPAMILRVIQIIVLRRLSRRSPSHEFGPAWYVVGYLTWPLELCTPLYAAVAFALVWTSLMLRIRRMPVGERRAWLEQQEARAALKRQIREVLR